MFALFAVTAVSAKDVTIVPGDLTWTESTDPVYGQGYDVTSDDILVGVYKYEGGSPIRNPKDDKHIRLYEKSIILIKSLLGQNITNASLNCIQGSVALSFNDETVALADGKYAWSGSSPELRIVHPGGGQVRIDQITVTTEDGGVITLAAPTFSPAEGEYYGTQYVTISAVGSANIYYTTDESEPTTNSIPYTEPVEVAQSMTIKAIATLDGATSDVATAVYTIKDESELPNINLTDNWSKLQESGNWSNGYDQREVDFGFATVLFAGAAKQTTNITDCPVVKNAPVTVTLNDLSNDITGVTVALKQWTTKTKTVSLQYSFDGQIFEDAGISSDNFTLVGENLPAGTKAVRLTFNNENQVGIASIDLEYGSGSGEIVVSAPVFSPAAGTYLTAQTVTITAADGAAIYYTTNGEEPTTASTPYTEPIEVAQSMTIKAIAVIDGTASTVATAEYVIESLKTVADVAAFLALEDGEVAMISSDLTMVYQNGSYNYVTDGTDMLLIFGRTGIEYVQGDVISGGVYGRRDTYRGAPQMNLQIDANDDSSWASDQFKAATENTGSIAPTEVSDLATVTADGVNQYVILTGVTWNSEDLTLSNETGSVAVYKRFSGVEYPADGVYNVAGFVAVFDDNVQIYPTEFVDPYLVEAPTFSLEAGTYPEAVEVEIACATEGAEIRYTLDGTTPSAESALYDGTAIMIAETTTISAIAILGENSSEVSTATYTIAEPGEGPNINFVGWAFPGADEWSSMYEEHVVNFGFATVTFASADKQSGTITDCPVTKGGDVVVELNSANNVITGIIVNLKQWTDKTQTATLWYSTDGLNFEETGTESDEFYLENSTLPEGTVAVKITFGNQNQVGIASIDLDYESVTTGVENVDAEGVKVIGVDGGIVVAGDAADVEVYTIGGALVGKAETTRIDCAAGIYIVKVDGTVHKVIVK